MKSAMLHVLTASSDAGTGCNKKLKKVPQPNATWLRQIEANDGKNNPSLGSTKPQSRKATSLCRRASKRYLELLKPSLPALDCNSN